MNVESLERSCNSLRSLDDHYLHPVPCPSDMDILNRYVEARRLSFPIIQDIHQVFDNLTKCQRYDGQVVTSSAAVPEFRSEYPNTAATAAPIRSASENRRATASESHPLYIFEKSALANAPTHINPACPRLSSPRIPTTRFRETAMNRHKCKAEPSGPEAGLEYHSCSAAPWSA